MLVNKKYVNLLKYYISKLKRLDKNEWEYQMVRKASDRRGYHVPWSVSRYLSETFQRKFQMFLDCCWKSCCRRAQIRNFSTMLEFTTRIWMYKIINVNKVIFFVWKKYMRQTWLHCRRRRKLFQWCSLAQLWKTAQAIGKFWLC